MLAPVEYRDFEVSTYYGDLDETGQAWLRPRFLSQYQHSDFERGAQLGEMYVFERWA